MLLALLFVTLPFVIRSVQPVLIELDREMEEAALLARRAQRGRSSAASILPNLVPAILSGAALAFARAVGEFGSIVLISGQHPVRHAGRVGLHLQADRERQPDRRGRRSRVVLLRSRSRC